MSKVMNFDVSGRLAILIGRENVPNINSAVIELIKNSYDADATVCAVIYDQSLKRVLILDNGTGMKENVIEKYWMNIGLSSKLLLAKTNKKRVPTGSKGVGRFALDKIASLATMITKDKESKSLVWDVDWDLLNSDKMISEIDTLLNDTDESFEELIRLTYLPSEVQKLVEQNSFSTGTLLVMENMREEWNTRKIRNIRRNLLELIPSGVSSEFKLYFFEPENMGLEKAEIKPIESNQFDYKLEFDVKSGVLTTEVIRNEFIFKKEFEKVMLEGEFKPVDREYFSGVPKVSKTFLEDVFSKSFEIESLGDFSGELYFYKLSSSRKDREKYYLRDVKHKRYVDVFGGIKVYRDNFRVRPYGESGSKAYDWLGLNSRKTASPAGVSHKSGTWKVRAEQIYGVVNISKLNHGLNDMMSRDGFLNSDELVLFESIIEFALRDLEEDRQYVFRKLDSVYQRRNPSQKFEDDLKNKYKNRKDITNKEVRNTIEQTSVLIDDKNKKIEELEDELRILRTLATSGILSNSYSHEISSFNHQLITKLRLLSENYKRKQYDNPKLPQYVEQMSNILKNYSNWFKVTIKTLEKNKRTRKILNVDEVINNTIDIWNELLQRKKIDINYEGQDALLYCYEYDIVVILNNLIANSIDAFKVERTLETNKKIRIKLEEREDGIHISYSDLGPGLSGEFLSHPDRIFEPLSSSKKNGTGMGMWIIRNIVNDYDGDSILLTNKGGFAINLVLRNTEEDDDKVQNRDY